MKRRNISRDKIRKNRTSKNLSSIAKISKPYVTGILPRTRLYDILESNKNSPITFVVSPPGSGKTSLISSYLSERKIPYLWYSIDNGDGDIATFFYYMGMAAQRAIPGKRAPLPLYTPECAHGVAVFARRYFEILFSRIQGSFTFVFDNYQDVPVKSHFHNVMSYWLSDIPENINIIILSRKGIPPQYSKINVYNRLNVIDWDTIKFTREEVQDLIEQKIVKTLNREEFQFLYEKTNGWAAGLTLYLKDIGQKDFHDQLSDVSSKKDIFAYFAREMFHNFDKEIRGVLLKTSFLPTLTLKMVERLQGIKKAEYILDRLIKECCFMERYSRDNPIYRYHPLFREFLLSQAKVLLKHDELSRMKHDAAILLEESGNIEDAVALYREVGDVKSLVPIILKWAPSLVKQGRYQTLSMWLESIPADTLSKTPWLVYWMGICLLPFDSSKSRDYFEKAFHHFRGHDEVAGSFLSWAGLVESIILGRAGLKPLDHLSQVVEQMVKEFEEFPSEDIEAEVARSALRILSFRKPQSFDAKKWLDRVHSIAEKTSDMHQKIETLTALAGYLYSVGKFDELEITLEKLQVMVQQHESRPLTRLTLKWLMAAFFNVKSMYEECGKVVSEGIELAHGLKMKVMEIMLLGHGALSKLKQGELSIGRQHLQKMASSLSLMKPWEEAFYQYCAAWVFMYENNLSQALTHADRCLSLCKEMGNPWTLSIAHVLKAYLSAAFGKDREAMQHISRAHALGVQSKNEFTPFICLLTEAFVYLQKDKEGPALQAMRKGLRIGREKGFMNPYMYPKGVLETIASKALEHGIEETYVKVLIKTNAILPHKHHAIDEVWPWPLKIYTLGRFGLITDGKPVHLGEKVQRKPLQLLKALIAFGGRSVSEERIIDALWPEAYGDAAYTAFKTTLSRLRDLLGFEKALTVKEGKVTIDPRYCWVDVWTFERLINQIERMWNDRKTVNNLANFIELSQKVYEMYTGHFLSEDAESWTVSFREHLRSKFLRNIEIIGQLCEQVGDYKNAVKFYQKGIDADDLTEKFYQRLMACYQKMGRKAEAFAVYDRCRKTLAAALDIEPSPETEVLARAIRR